MVVKKGMYNGRTNGKISVLLIIAVLILILGLNHIGKLDKKQAELNDAPETGNKNENVISGLGYAYLYSPVGELIEEGKLESFSPYNYQFVTIVFKESGHKYRTDTSNLICYYFKP